MSRGQLKLHLGFAIPVAVLTAVCMTLYFRQSLAAGTWVGGGSWSGLLCGVIAGAIILSEMLLWPRKALRRFRLIPTKYWMAAHLWMGLASLPLAIVHCGFHLGGWLPATLLILLVLTVLSGVYGLAVQNVLPRWMLRHLPRETIYNQIQFVSDQAVRDARQLLTRACGRNVASIETAVADPELLPAGAVVVGAVRQAGKTRGKTLQTRHVAEGRFDRETLWSAFDQIEPYLREGDRVESPVRQSYGADRWFRRLREACHEESQPVIDVLQDLCDQRREFDLQRRVHRLLHTWLPVHIGLSVAVTILLGIHVWTALKFW
ncbi:hypothetical protein [Roseiconus nitratireducens]|uniref:hypothetical protein n=1 Tax=Roseiconus nitratireducens TaxID=2605748 RepID=UPI001F4696A3|nr:hypothetical protein [Roseiconus nitratireducens]